MELESKAVDGHGTFEVKQAFDEFMRGFEAFKQSNDQRLAELADQERVGLSDESATMTRGRTRARRVRHALLSRGRAHCTSPRVTSRKIRSSSLRSGSRPMSGTPCSTSDFTRAASAASSPS